MERAWEELPGVRALYDLQLHAKLVGLHEALEKLAGICRAHHDLYSTC